MIFLNTFFRPKPSPNWNGENTLKDHYPEIAEKHMRSLILQLVHLAQIDEQWVEVFRSPASDFLSPSYIYIYISLIYFFFLF